MPPKHPLQLTDVVVLAHVYVLVPPITVNEPELIHNETVPQADTVTVVVPVPHAKL